MLLRTDVPMPVLEGLRNLTFESGLAVSAFFDQIELRREDVIMGVTVVSVQMIVMPYFGGAPAFTKTVTSIFTADGVILDGGSTTGIASVRFDLSIGEMTSIVPRVFLVTVTDSLGRETKYDSGYLLPILVSPEETPVDHVVISPTELLAVALGSTVQMAAVAYDADGHALPGRVVTYSTSDPLVATVNEVGTVTSVGLGDVTITAASGGKQASAQLSFASDILMHSSFTDGDGTDLDGWVSDTGQAWSVYDGAVEIQDNLAQPTSAAATAAVPVGSADGTYLMRMYSPWGSVPIVRSTDENNWAMMLLGAGTGAFQAYRREAGVNFLQATGPAPWDDPANASFQLDGTSISVDVEGVNIISGLVEPFNAASDEMGFTSSGAMAPVGPCTFIAP